MMLSEKMQQELEGLKVYYKARNIVTMEYRLKNLEKEFAESKLEHDKAEREHFGGVIHRINSTKVKRLNKVTDNSPKRHVGFIDDSYDEVTNLFNFYKRVIGERIRGNKRLGRRPYYSDLIKYFLLLQRRQIKLPKNFLSKKVSELGLLELLKQHKKIPLHLADKKSFNSRDLEKIRKSNHPAFSRIIEMLKKYPP